LSIVYIGIKINGTYIPNVAYATAKNVVAEIVIKTERNGPKQPLAMRKSLNQINKKILKCS
jgi:hypothetical protein